MGIVCCKDRTEVSTTPSKYKNENTNKVSIVKKKNLITDLNTGELIYQYEEEKLEDFGSDDHQIKVPKQIKNSFTQ